MTSRETDIERACSGGGGVLTRGIKTGGEGVGVAVWKENWLKTTQMLYPFLGGKEFCSHKGTLANNGRDILTNQNKWKLIQI